MVFIPSWSTPSLDYVPWDEGQIGNPRWETSMVVHFSNMQFMALIVGSVLTLTYAELVSTRSRVGEMCHSKPGIEPELDRSSLDGWYSIWLRSANHNFDQTTLRRQNSEDLHRERLYGAPRAFFYFTVLDAGDQSWISTYWIEQQIKDLQKCDTYQQAFLRGVVFMTSASIVTIGRDVENILKAAGVKWISWLTTPESHQYSLRPGSYCTNGILIYELHRLYDDTHDCFVTSVIQKSLKQSFKSTMYHSFTRSSNLAVAVPSCLKRYGASSDGLAGLRIAVKDNFDMAGTRTSLCNRAYDQFYPPSQATATCIQELLAKGAVVVGKTKLASFAATEEPIECIDWPAPWNPRADGYQSPAGSSSGSAAAVAAYPWLDIAIGSDTSGSGRRPGHWNGVVAMRPTHGVLNTTGLVPSFERFDVPAFFGRDLGVCVRFARAWYGEKLPSVRGGLPVKIVLPLDYLGEIGNQDQLRLIRNFTDDMGNFFGVAVQEIDLESLWAQNPPLDAEGRGMSEYMRTACRDSFWYDDFHHRGSFRRGYMEDVGKKPFTSPPVSKQWDIALNITRDERDAAVQKLEVYRQWFTETVMRPDVYDTIVVLPVEEINPRYRFMPPVRDFEPRGVGMLFLSPIIGGPELTIPIGEVPYISTVTGNTEQLPVGLSLMASPGDDITLMDRILGVLKHANRPTCVQAGQQMFAEPQLACATS